MDLERLDEAIKQMELRGARVASQAAADGIGTDLVLVLDAARAYADLLVNGERVEWCEEHEFQIKPGANVCLASPFTTKSCRRIGDRLLIDPPKEEE